MKFLNIGKPLKVLNAADCYCSPMYDITGCIVSTESGDSDNGGNMVTIAVLGVLLVVSLICCLGLIVIVFKQNKKIILLQEKMK